jgi:uracil-DNA glycosylase
MGLRDLSKDFPWSVLSTIDEKQRKNILNSICVVNIKKTPGAGTADEEAVIQIAEQDEELLRKQFALYKPDLVVCCGSAPAYEYHKLFGENTVWQITSQGLKYWRSTNGTFVVQVAHPQARVSANALYDALIGSVREITQGRFSGPAAWPNRK